MALKFFPVFLLSIISSQVYSQVGEEYDNETEAEAVKLVDMQIEGYNARDIDKFLEPYSDSVAVYTFPYTLRYKGKERMRSGYSGMFSNVSELHCKIVNRIVYGNTVVDEELITVSNGTTFNALAIYTINEGKITEVYFVPKPGME